jgi:hypothetical protein
LTSRSPPDTLIPERRRGTTEPRNNLDRHASYVVTAFVAGAA